MGALQEHPRQVSKILRSQSMVERRLLFVNDSSVLLNVDLGDMTGFLAAERAEKRRVPCQHILSHGSREHRLCSSRLDLGAAGYIFKLQVTRGLVKALDAAL
jgi:DNA-binding NarL/FixJ family response regulator